MPNPITHSKLVALRRSSVLAAATVLLATTAWGAAQATTGPQGSDAHGTRTVSFHGYRIAVPSQWKVVDLAARPHACLRFDRPAVYLGHAGDQSACPAHLIGGAPGLQIEPLDAHSAAELTRSTVLSSPAGAVRTGQLPRHGPVSIAVRGAGVLLTAVYAPRSATAVTAALASGRVLANAHPAATRSGAAAPAAPTAAVNEPGSYLGRGFDACTAPSQAAMNAWLAGSSYAAVGVYIGGLNRGCSQPNLTAAWVAQQVHSGWHLIPTYVGLQAPCTSFYNRMSSDPATARAQGRAEARDAVSRATGLGIAAPSTVYSDIEGYNSTISSCVAAVLSYVSGWTHVLHASGYKAGVYSSGASGISNLSANYNSTAYLRPDNIWLAWWNYAADVNGGSYVPDTQWSNHQRVHQYVGNSTEAYGGYRINIDQDFLDVGTLPAGRAPGCPTNLNFSSYFQLRRGDQGAKVLAAQCLLISRGFHPGSTSGTLDAGTAAAIKAFKTARGLASNSVLGRGGWTALLSAGHTPFLKRGSTGAGVRKLQRSLTAALGRPVTIDGTFAHSTRQAVVDYQSSRGLTVNGTVGPPTWSALQAGR
jgi:Rv2525c-like, glycoside hydrolase-like domain/Putative peptidoglycan binding domain